MRRGLPGLPNDVPKASSSRAPADEMPITPAHSFSTSSRPTTRANWEQPGTGLRYRMSQRQFVYRMMKLLEDVSPDRVLRSSRRSPGLTGSVPWLAPDNLPTGQTRPSWGRRPSSSRQWFCLGQQPHHPFGDVPCQNIAAARARGRAAAGVRDQLLTTQKGLRSF